MNIGVIPARLHSTRFPKKILAPIQGKPMIVHVFEKAKKAKRLDKVVIAIDAEETKKALKDYKVDTVMTFSDHVSGTDRVCEVVKNMAVDIVVNIQGDEPGMDPNLIDRLVGMFDEKNVYMATAATTDITPADFNNPSVVKILVDNRNTAVAFRREPRTYETGGYYRHIGIYAFKKQALLKFAGMSQSENEKKYKLEQLRVLDNGLPIHVLITNYSKRGIDTVEDYNHYCGQYG